MSAHMYKSPGIFVRERRERSAGWSAVLWSVGPVDESRCGKGKNNAPGALPQPKTAKPKQQNNNNSNRGTILATTYTMLR